MVSGKKGGVTMHDQCRTMVLMGLCIMVMGLGMFTPSVNAASGDKVTICHFPPGNPSNPREITVAASAVPAHLEHGDFVGSCEIVCGNGICDPGEDAFNCADDCGACGNGICDAGENVFNCAADCTVCGDAICSAGEDAFNCAADCGCAAPGACGAQAPAGCFCDPACIGFGDCCPDACSACGVC